MSIQKRISISILVFAIIIILVVGVFSIYVSRDTLIDRSQSFLETILDSNKYEIERHLFASQKVTQTLYDEISVTFNYKKDQIDETYRAVYLERIKSSVKVAADLSPSKSAFLILNKQGQDLNDDSFIWYSDIDGDIIPEQNPSLEILENINWDLIVENRELDLNTKWIIMDDGQAVYCVRLLVQNDEISGVVGNGIGYNEIKNIINATRVMESGFLFLANQAGQMIYNPAASDIEEKIDIQLINESDESEARFTEKSDVNQTQMLVGTTELSNLWFIGLTVKVDEVVSGLDKIVFMIIAMMLTALILTLLFSSVVSKRLAEPFIYISNKIDKIGHGDYDVKIDNEYNERQDEVGVLSRSLEIMIHRQKESFEKIKSHNVELENKVDERTKELKDSNSALEEAMTEVEENQEVLQSTNDKLQQSIEEITRTRKKLIETEKIASLRYIAIGLAHRMNTPIGNAKVIGSYVMKNIEKVRDDLSNSRLSKEQLRSFLEDLYSESGSIITNLDVCVDMINKLKDYTTENTQVVTHQVDIEKIIQDQNSAVHLQYPKKKCTINYEIEDGLVFNCDFYSLEKLIYELIENSYLHAFDHLENPEIKIKVYQDIKNRAFIIIEYSDNGSDVENKKVKDLFTPMYTSKLSSKFGLGLSMVYALVSATFEGEIDVKQGLNTGLGFMIRLKSSDRLE